MMDDYVPSDDDDDTMDVLDSATVKDLHFGGGLMRKKEDGEGEGGMHR